MFSPLVSYSVGTHSVPETARYIRVDTSGGNVILNLPAGGYGPHFVVKKITNDSNTITINPPGGKTIDGASAANIVVYQQSMWLVRLDSGDYDVASKASGGGGGGGGGSPLSAALWRLAYDPGTESIVGPTTYGGTYGKTGGVGTYDGSQRNSQDFDTVVWASPGMVDLVANPRRITITEDGIYYCEGVIEFNNPSTENIICIMKNGYDSVGSHLGGLPATDGHEPYGGEFISLFGFTSGAASELLQTRGTIELHAGDFLFLEHQCDVAYKLNNFTNHGYLYGVIPSLVVTKIGDIPA